MSELDHALAVARRAAHDAGQAAQRLQSGVGSVSKSDGSPVSDGDIAADRIIREQLRAAFPADGVLSEELTDSAERLGCRRVWIIDPIDGTRSYVDGGEEWCVQVALAVDGDVVLGVLDLPARGMQVWAMAGRGAGIVDAAGERPLVPVDGARDVLAGSSSERSRTQVARVLAALPEFTHLPAHSVGVKAAQILLGEADLFVHPRHIAEWDAAAPAAILRHAGASATDLAGAPLRFNTQGGKVPGLVFSRRADHAVICDRLGRAGLSLP